jgi:lysophospholipase L1-like esterase
MERELRSVIEEAREGRHRAYLAEQKVEILRARNKYLEGVIEHKNKAAGEIMSFAAALASLGTTLTERTAPEQEQKQ